MPLLFKFLAAGLAGLALAALLLVLHKIITNRLSLLRFKKLSKGMPVYEPIDLLGNHIGNLALGRENCRQMQSALDSKGPYLGGLLGNKFVMLTTDLDLIKRIVIDEQHLDRTSLDLPMSEYEQSLMLVPGHEWRRQRRVFAPAMKSNKFKMPNVLAEIEATIQKVVGAIERHLDERQQPQGQNKKVLMDDLMHKYSLNMVFSCFYKQYNQIDFDDPHDKWIAAMDSMLHNLLHNPAIKLSMIFPWLRRPLDWFIWNFHPQGVARRHILDFVKVQTKLGMEARKHLERAEASKGSKAQINRDNFVLGDGTRFKRNLVDGIIDGFLDGKLTRTEYFNSSCFLLAAANRAVADCLTLTIYLLAVYPEVQERLRASIQCEGAESVYLGWVLYETVRLVPPVPVGPSRTVYKDIPLPGGLVVPKGTFVIANAFVIHRLKQYWGEDADEFKPERWADTSKHHPMQFMGFGAGPRGCPGGDFGLFHMRSLFAALLTRYSFQAERRADPYAFDAPNLIFTMPHSPTLVTIERITS